MKIRKNIYFILTVVLFIFLNIITYSQTKSLSRYSIDDYLDHSNRSLQCTQNIIIKNTFTKPTSRFYFQLPNKRSKPNPYISDLANDVGYVNGYQPDPVIIKTITASKT